MNSRLGIKRLLRFMGFQKKETPACACCEKTMQYTAVEFFEWWEHNADRMTVKTDEALFRVVQMSEGARWN